MSQVRASLESQSHKFLVEGTKLHSAGIPFFRFQTGPCLTFERLLASACDWQLLSNIRSWARFRAGVLCLGHVNNKPSTAAVVRCIACDTKIGLQRLQRHVLCVCPMFTRERSALCRALGRDLEDSFAFCCEVLGLSTADSGFSETVELCSAVAAVEQEFCFA